MTSRLTVWMRRLQAADPAWSFRLGPLLFLVMPTDILTMITVGRRWPRRGDPWWQSLPFVALTAMRRLLQGP